MLLREFRYPWYISPGVSNAGVQWLNCGRQRTSRKFLFRFYDGVEFIVDRLREDIWVNDLRMTSRQAAIHHLLFSLPGFLLGLRKSACLRGAVIGGGTGAIALLGESNSGKSVLSANMAARGFEV